MTRDEIVKRLRNKTVMVEFSKEAANLIERQAKALEDAEGALKYYSECRLEPYASSAEFTARASATLATIRALKGE